VEGGIGVGKKHRGHLVTNDVSPDAISQLFHTNERGIILQSQSIVASDGAAHHPQFAHSAEPRWLTADQVAAYLQVERRTVLKWANSGKLKAYALSGTRRRTWRFLKLDVDAIFAMSSEPLSFSGRVM
jgi:excisionase family DNA binding protein